MISNGKRLIKSSENPEHLPCLNGIKAIVIAWTIVGHEYEMYEQGPIENSFDLQAVRQT